MRSKFGTFLIFIGSLFLLSAACLLAYNSWDDWRAGRSVAEVQDLLTEEELHNDRVSGSGFASKYDVPLDGFMPSIMIDGYEYIGILSIPRFGLALPVMSEWSYDGMKTAPGRYTGSVWSDDMVICGHNYERHFGNLKYLEAGDQVAFTDVYGNVFEYEVEELLILPPSAVDEMVMGEWDLTLFTCTYGGRTRITVRCTSVPSSSR